MCIRDRIEIGLRAGEKMYEELLISGNEEKTDHEKIFKSTEASLNFDEMEDTIADLKESINLTNLKWIQDILKSVVDGYNH